MRAATVAFWQVRKGIFATHEDLVQLLPYYFPFFQTKIQRGFFWKFGESKNSRDSALNNGPRFSKDPFLKTLQTEGSSTLYTIFCCLTNVVKLEAWSLFLFKLGWKNNMVKIFSNSHKKKVNRFKAVFFLTTPLSISRSFAREAPIFIFWHLSRRDLTTLTWTRLLQGIASSHPHISLNRNLAVPWVTPLISNYVCWMFFLVPSVHAMGCKKTKYGYGTRTSWRERHFCCAISIDTPAASRNWKVNM